MLNIEKMQEKVEELLRKSENLGQQIDEITERCTRPGTDANAFATVPLLFAEVIRSLLEDSRRWWMRNCAMLFCFWIVTLLALIGVVVS